jgi:hypothetical protein
MVTGYGVFISTDKGQSFVPTGQGPKQPSSLKQGSFAPDGSFWGVDPDTQTIWQLKDKAWLNKTPNALLKNPEFSAIAIEPKSSDIYVFDHGGKAVRSVDNGNSWQSLDHETKISPKDPPWLKVSNQSYFATSKVRFDPQMPNRLWVSSGVGVFYADVSDQTKELNWVSQTRGIEELVANDIAQSPNRAPLFAVWDFGIHLKSDLNQFSTTYGPAMRTLIAAQQMATTPANPDFVVTNASDTRTFCCSEDGNAVMAGFSLDAGQTWQKFATLPQPPGTEANDPWRMSFGMIAVSATDSQNIIWAPTYNRSPFYTKDRGQTWKRVKLKGEVLPFTGSHSDYYLPRRTLTADRVLAYRFYYYHSGEGQNQALKGLWVTNDGGDNWEKVFNGEITPMSGFAAKLRAVPGHAGHLFFTSSTEQPNNNPLRRSLDGGQSFEDVKDLNQVDDIAFGKAAKGSDYPTLFISGRVKGVYGLWRSVDNARSWERLVDFPMGRLDQAGALGADPDVFGRVYIGYLGSGFMYGEPATCTVKPYSFGDAGHCFNVGN